MSDKPTQRAIEAIVAALEIPPSAYERAEKRYKDVGDWFDGPSSVCSKHDPHIYAQGSFRLGTVVRPLDEKDEYDLDLGCRLRQGVSKATHTQKQLKRLVGVDLESYRIARGIEAKLEEKSRCWRLSYADELSFHMDQVPSIPEDVTTRENLKAAMVKFGSETPLAETVANFAGAITDNGLWNYDVLSSDWKVSNSEGYALWFESRLKLAAGFLQKRAFDVKAAQVDDLPVWQWKAPLQQVIQILKRHRDVMYAENSDSKPISIILTTLAAAAYQGEADVASALERVLADMGRFVRPTKPRVPNPVNPSEDFADKWSMAEHAALQLEDNFWGWLHQARADFAHLREARSAEAVVEQAKLKFAVKLNPEDLGMGAPAISAAPKVQKIIEPAKPWGRQ
jgi:hypothetical protein